jgi:hypothetical protein
MAGATNVEPAPDSDAERLPAVADGPPDWVVFVDELQAEPTTAARRATTTTARERKRGLLMCTASRRDATHNV